MVTKVGDAKLLIIIVPYRLDTIQKKKEYSFSVYDRHWEYYQRFRRYSN